MIRRRRQRGMTLVEVMVASVILSLVMMGAVTALRTFGRSYDRLLFATDNTSEMREVSRFLRLSLRSALNDPRAFVGGAQSLIWATPLDRAGSAGGIQYLRISREGDALMLSFAPYIADLVGIEDPEWSSVIDDYVLVDGLDSIAFSYFDNAEMAWIDEIEGDEVPTIPSLVSLQIRSDDDEWPPIVVNLNSGPR